MLQLKSWSMMGASNHPAYADNYIHVFSLIHPVDRFSFKEMRTRDQSKISSCCLCVWCKPKELGGRRSIKFPTSMVESFSGDFLPAIESYCGESHLEFCQTSATELLCESMWTVFR